MKSLLFSRPESFLLVRFLFTRTGDTHGQSNFFPNKITKFWNSIPPEVPLLLQKIARLLRRVRVIN